MTYYQAFISCENVKQGNQLLDALLTERVCVGGPILEGPAKVWWKGDIVTMPYCYILTYTRESHKERLMKICEAHTEEELVGISLVPFEGNKKFVEYIDQALDL